MNIEMCNNGCEEYSQCPLYKHLKNEWPCPYQFDGTTIMELEDKPTYGRIPFCHECAFKILQLDLFYSERNAIVVGCQKMSKRQFDDIKTRTKSCPAVRSKE